MNINSSRLKFLIVLITNILLVATSAWSQSATVVTSVELNDDLVSTYPVNISDGLLVLGLSYDDTRRIDDKMVLSINNDARYYNYIQDENRITLTKFDLDLNVVGTYPLKIEDATDIYIYNFINYDNKLRLYYAKRESFGDDIKICYLDIDTEKYKRHKETTIRTINARSGIPATRMLLSADSTKIAFISEKQLGNNDEQSLDIAVMNIQGTPMWSDPVYLGRNRGQIELLDFEIDNTGNIYLAYHDYRKYNNDTKDKDKNGDDIPSYELKIITYGLDETELLTTINTQKQWTRNCNLKYIPSNNTLAVVGTYSKKDGGNVTGIYHTAMDISDFKSSEVNLVPYSRDLILQIDEDGFANKKEKDPGIEYRIMQTEILIKSDGSLVYAMQPYRTQTFRNNTSIYSYRRPTTFTYIEYYVAKSIIVADINNSNTSFTRIPRDYEEFYYLPEGMATFTLVNDRLYTLYPETWKNIERELSKRPDDTNHQRNTNLTLATIDSNGNVHRDVVKSINGNYFEGPVGRLHRLNDRDYLFNFFDSGFFSSKRYIGLCLLE